MSEMLIWSPLAVIHCCPDCASELELRLPKNNPDSEIGAMFVAGGHYFCNKCDQPFRLEKFDASGDWKRYAIPSNQPLWARKREG